MAEKKTKRDTRYDKPKSGMNFEGGAAVFLSRYKAYSCWPDGVPTRVLSAVPGAPPVNIQAFHAEFANNMLRVTDPESAKALIDYAGHFENPKDGYTISTDCIPSDLRQFWPNLTVENRRRIGMALCDGLSSQECFALVDPDDLKKAEPEVRASQVVMCPVSGCTVAPLQGKSAIADLMLHIKVAHPDYESETAH